MQPQADPFIVPKCHDEIEILFQDEHILVINKPSGLLSLSGKHPLNIDSVHHRLVQAFPTCALIHRLDFGTSGVMLLAMNKQINALLCKQFSERRVSKRYVALLHGTLVEDTGLVDQGVAKDSDNFPLMKLCQQTGKPARSKYCVIERFTQSTRDSFFVDDLRAGNRQVTRVEFEPITGRTHQLRLHSQHIGHPILGCDLYATDEAYFMSSRLMLHASELIFEHPISLESMTIKCNSPF
ncbi:RluA family pseudouridine synthase [Shewanella eurypsychrophilus]|uniref:RluA family pseudouridine synthase n=1 Tax=Shewanella eurypsychrophilus TaxID=2593656 RepID=A0ABX6V9A5_9GAMM|nr:MULTISPECIES: RluA family pseudouridine synthase [Shewanella]QFU22835.1 RluA family pseudouridine synthase [Shewanella sp. YLB-09]QPG58122.1 RluA family pseudouridine synthase [Shewanella eurypsychrophilus]